MPIKKVKDPDAKKLKKKERIKLLEELVKQQGIIIENLEAINASADPHSNWNENNLCHIKINNAREKIISIEAKLEGKKVVETTYRMIMNGELQ